MKFFKKNSFLLIVVVLFFSCTANNEKITIEEVSSTLNTITKEKRAFGITKYRMNYTFTTATSKKNKKVKFNFKNERLSDILLKLGYSNHKKK